MTFFRDQGVFVNLEHVTQIFRSKGDAGPFTITFNVVGGGSPQLTFADKPALDAFFPKMFDKGNVVTVGDK